MKGVLSLLLLSILSCLLIGCVSADDDCTCKLTNDPVCSTTGISFINKCLAKCQSATIASTGLCPGDKPFASTEANVNKHDYSRHHGFVLAGKIATSTSGPSGLNTITSAQALSLVGNTMKPNKKKEHVQAVRIMPDGLFYVQEEPTLLDFSTLSDAASVPELPTNPSVLTSGKRRGLLQTDNRVEVSNPNQFPYYAIGELSFSESSTTLGMCSGTFVSAQDVLTAGHCTYDVTSHTTFTGWTFYLANNGVPPGAALATFNYEYFTIYKQLTTQTQGVNYYDIALIRMKTTNTHWLSIGSLCPSGSSSTLSATNVCGYPGDKCSTWLDCNMWCSASCTMTYYSCGSNNMMQSTNCYVYAGQSGSAVQDSSNIVRGTLSGAYTNNNADSIYVPIDSFHYTNIMSWINNGTGSSSSPPPASTQKSPPPQSSNKSPPPTSLASPPPPSPPPSVFPSPSTQSYFSFGTGTTGDHSCITIPGDSSANGIALKQYTCDNDQGQLFYLVNTGNYWYNIMDSYGRCMTVSGNFQSSVVTMSTCTGGSNQKIGFFTTSLQYNYFMKALSSNMCLDVYGFSTYNGASIVQNHCSNYMSQVFQLQT